MDKIDLRTILSTACDNVDKLERVGIKLIVIMIIRINKKVNCNYNITTRGGAIIHSDKDLNFVIEYLKNQLQSGFQEIRITI